MGGTIDDDDDDDGLTDTVLFMFAGVTRGYGGADD